MNKYTIYFATLVIAHTLVHVGNISASEAPKQPVSAQELFLESKNNIMHMKEFENTRAKFSRVLEAVEVFKQQKIQELKNDPEYMASINAIQAAIQQAGADALAKDLSFAEAMQLVNALNQAFFPK